MDPKDIFEPVTPENIVQVVTGLVGEVDVKEVVEAVTEVGKDVEEIVVATLNIKTVDDVVKVAEEVEVVVQQCSTMAVFRRLLQSLSQLLSRRTVPLKSE
jgi:spore coat polysaccharide biosynthesis protein SpsF (cytidylyltransferase family)